VISWQCASWILVGGVAAVLLKTRVDLEKTWLREAGEDECLLWGRPAKFIKAEYKDATGQPKTTRLLISGSWGIARHFNYTLELLSTLLWTLPCSIGWGLPPTLYFLFLFLLLTHRIFRDEEKCSNKYGPYWKQYCAKVPYRLIPYVF
jgi:7-dehydrocholesterol reductase